jgi:hypothetical protein
MPTAIGANLARRKLANDELVLCLGVNQLRTPNFAMIAAACGSDVGYFLSAGRADVRQQRAIPLEPA